jgi:tRNA(fMet)-specific endonuclease VapC
MRLYVLDTDILTLFQRQHPVVLQNIEAHAHDQLAITVITVEEQLTGWYRVVRRAKRVEKLAEAYDRLTNAVSFLSSMTVLSFPPPAIERYEALKKQKLNIRAMDLRIAAISLHNKGTVVSRNLSDFKRIPGLTVEDWSV